ncbi:hypothetical protein [Pseudemcibacter aquimaris]|uniref:hypothetical protein n=1 Tax=Pseudemcibacter aquimaris TaxID=2857064 RepID=UPI002011FECA|nr:hypothetical protein [Pseudemcibacter aquimaris]MCC3860844.1 hypothetical protein [Pseudemcibacter aquimaris]WDU59663.1 hypothetical protein KW060_05240 [Pseudemcibacter aquimaris]
MDTLSEEYKKYQKLVEGKNINPQTLLATDYLNHFNEIHMLIGMIADMPECLEDILEWEALSYQDHFKYSVFQDKDLAIEAYDHSPERYKKPFEDCVAEMDELLLSTIKNVEEAIKTEDKDYIAFILDGYTPSMERLIEQCSHIINSTETTAPQDNIDDFFDADSGPSDTNDQSAIDDLFD